MHNCKLGMDKKSGSIKLFYFLFKLIYSKSIFFKSVFYFDPYLVHFLDQFSILFIWILKIEKSTFPILIGNYHQNKVTETVNARKKNPHNCAPSLLNEIHMDRTLIMV